MMMLRTSTCLILLLIGIVAARIIQHGGGGEENNAIQHQRHSQVLLGGGQPTMPPIIDDRYYPYGKVIMTVLNWKKQVFDRVYNFTSDWVTFLKIRILQFIGIFPPDLPMPPYGEPPVFS